MSRWFRTVRFLGAGVMVVALLAAGCSGDDDGGGGASTDDSTPSEAGAGDEQLTGAAFVEPGPHAAGVTTIDLPEGREADVWYPADPEAIGDAEPATYDVSREVPESIRTLIPADIAAQGVFTTDAYADVPPASGDGPYPLVVFSHGFGSFRTQSSFLTSHLATWGFVVVSPDFPERGLSAQLGEPPAAELSNVETIDNAIAAVAAAGGVLDGLAESEQVAVVGHSAGGSASAEYSTEADVVTFVPLSSGAARRDESTPEEDDRIDIELGDVPSLWMVGADDGVADPEGVVAAFERASTPTRLVQIEGAGHNDAMSDICDIGTEGGGIVALGLEAGLPVPETLVQLGQDGCVPEGLPSEPGQQVVDQAVTSQLRWAFGIDEEPVGLDAETLNSITPVIYEERLD